MKDIVKIQNKLQNKWITQKYFVVFKSIKDCYLRQVIDRKSIYKLNRMPKKDNWYSVKMPKDYFNWDDKRRASITNEEKEQENIEKALEFIDQILR